MLLPYWSSTCELHVNRHRWTGVMPVMQQPTGVHISTGKQGPNTRAQSMFPLLPTHDMRGTAVNQLSRDARGTTGAASDMKRSITRTGRPTAAVPGTPVSFSSSPLPSPTRGGVSWQLHPGEVPRFSCSWPGVCLATAGWTESVWFTSISPLNTHRLVKRWEDSHVYPGAKNSWLKIFRGAASDYLSGLDPGEPCQAHIGHPHGNAWTTAGIGSEQKCYISRPFVLQRLNWTERVCLSVSALPVAAAVLFDTFLLN